MTALFVPGSSFDVAATRLVGSDQVNGGTVTAQPATPAQTPTVGIETDFGPGVGVIRG